MKNMATMPSAPTATVYRWDFLEIHVRLEYPDSATLSDAMGERPFNPFLDVVLAATFSGPSGEKTVRGFCDGGPDWLLRFMPEDPGEYRWTLAVSGAAIMDGAVEGSFLCVAPEAGNRGPVRVAKTFHFSYADGTPFFGMGTTAYGWSYRPGETRRQTVESVASKGFNKLRMLFFPKRLVGFDDIDISYEPPDYPYEGEPGAFDFARFSPDYFRRFESCVRQLGERGIEAEVILFHGYDFGAWGFDGMSEAEAMLFVDYIAARLSAFRNVWWSLANEYDLEIDTATMKAVSRVDIREWDRLGRALAAADPYDHPRSMHNWGPGPVAGGADWISHVSCQNGNTYSLPLSLRAEFGKPVFMDEYKYEGNLKWGWGNTKAETVVFRHWMSAMAGSYATHGECFMVEGNRRDIFWTYGGTMVGRSASRLAFLRSIVEALPFQDMRPLPGCGNGFSTFCLGLADECYLAFFADSGAEPGARESIFFGSPDRVGESYLAAVYDVWNCEKIGEYPVKSGFRRFVEPGWLAVALRRAR
jgi:hypothetical protein